MPDVPGLVPPGRLDRDTTGLLLLTNDGDLATASPTPPRRWKKYRLTLQNPVPESPSPPCPPARPSRTARCTPALSNLSRTHHVTTLDLTIHEGRNRIIRRACVAVGLRLVSLHRIRVGPVTLGDLPEGQYRRLTPESWRLCDEPRRRRSRRGFSVEDVRALPEELEITPLDRLPTTIIVPGSKSVTNRALLVAALADGPSTITEPSSRTIPTGSWTR